MKKNQIIILVVMSLLTFVGGIGIGTFVVGPKIHKGAVVVPVKDSSAVTNDQMEVLKLQASTDPSWKRLGDSLTKAQIDTVVYTMPLVVHVKASADSLWGANVYSSGKKYKDGIVIWKEIKSGQWIHRSVLIDTKVNGTKIHEIFSIPDQSGYYVIDLIDYIQ